MSGIRQSESARLTAMASAAAHDAFGVEGVAPNPMALCEPDAGSRGFSVKQVIGVAGSQTAVEAINFGEIVRGNFGARGL